MIPQCRVMAHIVGNDPVQWEGKNAEKTINFSILYRLRCCFIVSSPLWMYLMCEYKIKPDHISSVRSKERARR